MSDDAVDKDKPPTSDLPEQGPQKQFLLSPALISGLVSVVDVAAILLSAVGSYAFATTYNAFVLDNYIFATAFVCFVTVALFNHAELYTMDSIMRPVARSDAFIIGILTAFLFFLTIAFSVKVSEIYSRIWMYSFAFSSLLLVISCRLIAYRALKSLSKRNLIGHSMAVLGTGDQAREFVSRLERVRPYFTELRGIYGMTDAERDIDVAGHAVAGVIEDLEAAARRGDIDDVVVAMPWNSDQTLPQAVERLKELPINVYIGSDLVGFHLQFRPAFGTFENLPMFEVVQRPISGWSQLLKAIEDFSISLFAVVALSPVLLLTALAIKLNSKGPVLFKQKRLGFNNQEFAIYKFRSMYVHQPPEGRTVQAQAGDPRITSVGAFIRRTSIDELPQILNVLKGDMSLVGPRPHALDHNEEFARNVRGYFSRHKVKPGITGWAQVNGFRGETDTIDKIEGRVERDVYYAENWSLLFDIRIIIMTALVVLFQKSAR